MRLGGKKTKAVLVVLLLTSVYAAYRIGQHLWGRHHYNAAQAALERRDFGQASFHLNKCLAVWPRKPSLLLLAAQTARRGCDFDEARRVLRVCQQENGPENERLRELQLLLIVEGDLTEADELLDVCLSAPETPDAYLILEVVIEVKVKRLERAYNAGMTLIEGPAGEDRIKTEKAVALWFQQRPGQADRVQGLMWRGKLHLLTNQQEAAVDFREALELDPGHFDARLYLAVSLAEYDTREAARHLDMLRQRDPRNNQVCVLLASFRRGLGQFAEAQQILDEVLDSNPNHVAALLERGKTSFDARRPEEAERFLRRALALDPKEPFVHLALGRCLHLTGKEDEAKHHQQRYSEIESERTRAQQAREERERAARRARAE